MKLISLSARNLKEIYRDPVASVLGLIMPVALLVLFSSIYKSSHIELFSPYLLTPGIIVFCFAFLIMFSAGLIANDRQSALLIRFFTTPLRAYDYILAYLIPFLPIAFLQMIICLVTGTMLGATFQNIITAVIIFFPAAVICISLGMIMGSLLTVNQISGIGSVLVTAIGLFSGAWAPLKEMGGIFESAGYALPFAHAVDAARIVMSGVSSPDINRNIYIIVLYSVVLVILAVLSFRYRMRKETR